MWQTIYILLLLLLLGATARLKSWPMAPVIKRFVYINIWSHAIIVRSSSSCNFCGYIFAAILHFHPEYRKACYPKKDTNKETKLYFLSDATYYWLISSELIRFKKPSHNDFTPLRPEVLTAMKTQVAVFWVVTPCSDHRTASQPRRPRLEFRAVRIGLKTTTHKRNLWPA